MNFRVLRVQFLCLLVGVILFSACRKDGEVGLNTQPTRDLISTKFIDTSTVISYVLHDDSIRTSGSSIILLGSYVDPIFGTGTSSFYTQLNIGNNATDLRFRVLPTDTLILDSCILGLQYVANSDGRKFYGSLEQQTVSVYNITQDMHADSNYYHTRRILFDSLNPLATTTFTPQPDSAYVVSGVSYPPAFHVKIDSAFAAHILTAPDSSLVDNNAFHRLFKGIYVAPVNTAQSSGQGAVLYFDPYAPKTRLTFYYRLNHDPTPRIYPFEMNSAAARFNRFQHDISTATDPKRITTAIFGTIKDTTKADADTNGVYIQSMGGARTLIHLPYLGNWAKKGPISVNRAELLFKIDQSTMTTSYNPPAQLYLVAIDSTYKTFYFPVDFLEIASAYGGTYNASTQSYSFNIARHIQAILDKRKHNYGFFLLPSGSAVNAQRTVLFGSGKASNKIRFRLTCTKL